MKKIEKSQTCDDEIMRTQTKNLVNGIPLHKQHGLLYQYKSSSIFMCWYVNDKSIYNYE